MYSIVSAMASFLTVANVVWFLSVAMIACSLLYLLAPYIALLLNSLHVVVAELLCYAVTTGLFVYADGRQGVSRGLLAFSACILTLLCILFSCSMHLHDKDSVTNWVSTICFFLWSPLAVYFRSSSIGFIALLSLFTALNFTASSRSFGYVIGYRSEAALVRCMAVSLFIVGFYLWIKLAAPESTGVDVFRVGALFMGPLAFFVGALICSSKWYHEDEAEIPWVICNLLLVAALLACYFFGSLKPELGTLYGFAVIFSILFVMDKYIEIPWGDRGWVWGILGAGVALYAASFRAHILLEGINCIEV